MRRSFISNLAGVLALVLVGCASPSLPVGDGLLKTSNYGAAITALLEEEAARPDDGEVKRNLGIAYLKNNDPAAALPKLIEARGLLPEDATLLYFLGEAAEKNQNPTLALDAYSQHLAHANESTPVMRAKVKELAWAYARANATQAIAREAALRAENPSENNIAVPGFLNVSNDLELAPLSRGLSVILLTDLSRVNAFRILERERVETLISELQLASPGRPTGSTRPSVEPMGTTRGQKQRLSYIKDDAGQPYFDGQISDTKDAAFRDAISRFQGDHGLSVDGIAGPNTQRALDTAFNSAFPRSTAPPPSPVNPATAPRLGKLLSAGRLVQGSFVRQGSDTISLSAEIARVNTGSTSRAGAPVEGEVTSVLRLQKKLTYQILTALGAEPTRKEREEIDVLPTQSFGAFVAYSQGLDYEARGMIPEAIAAFQDAINQDPGFTLAQNELEMSSVTEAERAEYAAKQTRESLRDLASAPTSRLVRTGSWVGIGPGPSLDRWDDLDPASTDVQRTQQGRIVIEGDLPRGPRP